jgi:ABC-type transport system involved in multi-copper enzyme maturation permease subunit
VENIMAIARTTYSRVASTKALYLLWLILVALIATMNRYDVLSVNRQKILMVDLGLMLVSFVGAGSVLMVGGDIPRELRQRVAEGLLSKPVGRDQYLIGKFAGSLAFALMNVAIVSVGFCMVSVLTAHDDSQRQIAERLIQPLLGIAGMVIVLTAAATLFGTFLSEVPAVVATFLVFWLGHSTQIVLRLTRDAGDFVRMLGRGVYGLLPNLTLMNISDIASQGMFFQWPIMTWQYVVASLSYSVVYSAVLFAAALMVFRARDL